MIGALRWERLFGRTDRFAVRLGLGVDEHRTSFGRIELFAAGRCLTRNEHAIAGLESAIVWDLADFVAWVADGVPVWCMEQDFPFRVRRAATAADWLSATREADRPLTAGEHRAWRQQHLAYWERHSLAGIPGLAVLDVVFRRVLNDVEVSWTTDLGTTRADIRWLEPRGGVRLPAAEVLTPLLDAAADCAAELPPEVGRELGEAVRAAREAADQSAVRPPFSLAASGASVSLDDEDRRVLAEVVQRARSGPPTPHSLPARPCPPPLVKPWEEGYRLARAYREELGWDDRPAPHLPDFLRSLGVDVGEVRLGDPGLHGLSLVGPSYRPTICVNANSSRAGPHWSRAMVLAHELCHLIFDWRPGEDFSILSDDHADWPTEARANAFAAELVMPNQGLVEVLAGRRVDEAVLRDLMNRFGVGLQALTWHLYNLEVISDEERLRFVARAGAA